MTLQTDLCNTPLAASDGVPLGLPGYPPSYLFAIQLAITTIGQLLGTFILGGGKLGGPRWVDVTSDCQGLHWNRGGEPAQRPIAGALSLRLINIGDKWSPWQSPFFGPGTMMRVAVGDPTTLIPQFCGTTVSWNESSEGVGAYDWVDITVWENMFLLSEVNDHALAGVVGGGDTLTQRVDRLLTQAAWQFDREIMSMSSATFQATDFAQDVASELYRTVDSVDAVVYPAKDGMLVIRDRATGSGARWTYARPDQDPDSVVTANDDDRILASIDLARVGGSAVTYTNPGLAGRYQRRSTQRTDMITVAEPGDTDLARVADGILTRARQTYRPVEFSVEAGQGVTQSKLIVEADLGDRVTVAHGTVSFFNYAICLVEHDVEVAGGGLPYWRTVFHLDIEKDSMWTKPPTPLTVFHMGAHPQDVLDAGFVLDAG